MWPFRRRSAATKAPRAQEAPSVAAPIVPAALAVPRCSACARPLERRQPPPGSMLQPVYGGVVCRLCGWIECRDCKGSPSDAPCPVCASPVVPAYAALFEPPAS